MSSKTTTFKIRRYDPDQDRSWVQEYIFPLRQGMTVLEGLWHIVRHVDGSLCFRYSCRGAVCGSCAMVINDTIRLACHTQVSELESGPVSISPLPRMALIRDLIVDIEPFLEHYRSIEPYVVSASDAGDTEVLQSPEERKRIHDSVNCILCGSCQAACPLTGTDPDYRGPAALAAAHRFAFDSRNEAASAMLCRVNDIGGTDGCRTISRCTDVCPKGVAPSERIKELKQEIRRRAAAGTIWAEGT